MNSRPLPPLLALVYNKVEGSSPRGTMEGRRYWTIIRLYVFSVRLCWKINEYV